MTQSIRLQPDKVEVPRESVDLADLVTLLESAVNDLVFVGIAIAFLATLETRIKRHRALTGVVLAAVNEVEDLSTGLSRKIWQKIIVLDAGEERPPEP